MARASKRKRGVERREFTDALGRDNVLFKTPDDWVDLDSGLPPEMADEMVVMLRKAGALLWLYPGPNWTVRTRIAMPGPEPEPEFLRILAKYARDLAQAIERSGRWQPPPDNPWGDRPLPPGGKWKWD